MQTNSTISDKPIKVWDMPNPEPAVYPVAAYRRPDGLRVIVQSGNGNVLMSSRAKNAAWELRRDADLNVDPNGGITDDGGMFPVNIKTGERCEKIDSDADLKNIRWRRVFRFTRGL